MFLGKGVLKICRKFTGEHPCRIAISIKLLCNFIEITLWHGCCPLHLLHIFKTPFLKNNSEWLLLEVASSDEEMAPAKGSYILKYISVHRRPMHV